MKALMGLVVALSIPLMILNMLGGIASGIWLAVLRDWGTLGLGIGLVIASSLIVGFALMPAALLAAPAAYFAERGKMIGLAFFGALSSLYTLVLITVWCCGVLFLLVKDASAANFIPRLIWSYGVATGPWGSMALKQGNSEDGSAATFAVFLSQLAYLVIMLLLIFFPDSISRLVALKVFAGFMLVAFVIQMTLSILLLREHFAQKQILED